MKTVFDVIADPTRRTILDLLRTRPHLVGELADVLDITQPGVSKHLRILREVGLVTVHQDAQRRWYELQPEPLLVVEAWLADFRELWEQRFSNLDEYLKALQEKENDSDD
jgi:DNA-binding transcriptional ArsR family regulator